MNERISNFKTPAGEARAWAAYEAVLACWPVPYRELDLPTRFGLTHILSCGDDQAPALVLMHGQESNAASWLYNIAALSANFHVLAIDTIDDMGKSCPVRRPETRADYAAWLLDVFDGIQLTPVQLVGYSYGGFLALNFSLAYPERVTRLALLAPGCLNLGRPTLGWAWYGMPMILFPSPYTVRHFISGASRKGFSPDDPVKVQMVAGLPELSKLMFLQPSFSDQELRTLNLPILLLVGDHEMMYKPQQAFEQARQLFPRVQVELIPDAGHFLPADQPERVNQKLLDFFQTNP